MRLLRASVLLAAGLAAAGQTPNRDAIADLQSQVEELRATVGELRAELASLRAQVGAVRPGQTAAADPVAALTEEQQVTAAKVNEQDQTKVSSGSKYRVRLSGMALFNAFSTSGAVDNIDVPWIAHARAPGDSGGSFGATLRQSSLTLEVFGPEWGGARTSGDLTFDFFAGFPSMTEGLTAGLVRLRTAKARMDWRNTSIVAGQEAPFFSPRSPTSLASTAYPAFSYSGNLWTWTPQLYVERRFAGLSLQTGILDALTGELPQSEYSRLPTAGERSRMPAYAARAAWQRESSGFGVGGYYSRQDWGSGATVDSWAATGDWDAALGPRFSFSGELYGGRAIAGLGGGATASVIGPALPVDSVGGWSQLKFKPGQRIEFNAAYGSNHAFRRGLSDRNASAFVNTIFQPRSNLLFSLEYRRIWTRFSGPQVTAGHVNLGVGILF